MKPRPASHQPHPYSDPQEHHDDLTGECVVYLHKPHPRLVKPVLLSRYPLGVNPDECAAHSFGQSMPVCAAFTTVVNSLSQPNLVGSVNPLSLPNLAGSP